MIFQRFIFILALLLTLTTIAAPVTKYLPKDQHYNSKIPTPKNVLGFGLGERHIRHDQLINYFNKLAKISDRVKLTQIGMTNEFRPQILVTISAKENLLNLPAILTKRQDPKADSPLVIWLGYSIHGDEISGANAAMIVAYHLAASQNKSVTALLKNAIIVLEPSMNPDGMDKFVNWVNTFRGATPNPDPNHIEHHQGWFTGRTNHFGFDLNRDWLPLTQVESQHRIKYFYLYRPNVLGDFHEMGANNSYFFQPGIATRTNPITPKENFALTSLLSKYHAKTLDAHQRLYFSQESFDDFYYGKGSTYPDINGGIGILFEQASSRGYEQLTDNGLLTLEFSIQNHVLTSLSTIKGAWENRQILKKYRHNFYTLAEKAASKEDFSGYLIQQNNDPYRLNSFLNNLKQQQIKVYPITADFRFNKKLYRAQHSYFVPLVQPQYRLIKALFGETTHFKDNTFYDVSGWTLPLAMNISVDKIARTWGLKLAKNTWQAKPVVINKIDPTAYAYVFEWQNFLAPKLLNSLLNQGINARVANKPFTTKWQGSNKTFNAGTILIAAAIQHQKNWQKILIKASAENNIPIFSLKTGLTLAGIDLGSRSFTPVKSPKILLVGGKEISQYEAGEILFYLDDKLHIPITIVEHNRLASIDFSQYTHLIMVDGEYQKFDIKFEIKLTHWLKAGGTIFAQKRAAKWLADKGLLKVNFVSTRHLNQLFTTTNLSYKDSTKLAAKKRVAGAIFSATLDLSHPLAFGYQQSNLPIFNNSTLIMQPSSIPFMTVAKYTEAPLLSGYTDQNIIDTLANSPVIVAQNIGKGRIVATTDDLSFRGYWYGTAKILANSLFFSKAFSTPIK